MSDQPGTGDNGGAYESFLAISMTDWPEAARLDELRLGLPGRAIGGHGVRTERSCWPGLRLADLAEHVQDWEVEALAAAGRPATWPECPDHPRSHPLEPGADSAERAVWRCPRSRRAVCAIGGLGVSWGA